MREKNDHKNSAPDNEQRLDDPDRSLSISGESCALRYLPGRYQDRTAYEPHPGFARTPPHHLTLTSCLTSAAEVQHERIRDLDIGRKQKLCSTIRDVGHNAVCERLAIIHIDVHKKLSGHSPLIPPFAYSR